MQLGLADYQHILNLQRALLRRRVEGDAPNILILTEHNHVITLGKGVSSTDIFLSKDKLNQLNVPVYDVERGGNATYHGPGQLIGYPVLNLKECQLGLSDYIWKLEEVMIRILAQFGIQGCREGVMRGVWVRGKKIGSVGIAVKKWVAYHGFALNVNTDSSFFHLIKPCGLEPGIMDSMAEILGRKLNMAEVSHSAGPIFAGVFNMEIEKWIEDKSKLLPTSLVKDFSHRGVSG